MLASPTRQKASRARRHGHLLRSPRAEERAAIEVRTVVTSSTEEAAGSSAMPTLDDFGGRSDALGG
jgi:hypothetical protein